MKYFQALMNLREGYYNGAEINAYQIFQIYKKKPDLEWNDEYFKIWVVSGILKKLKNNIKLEPKFFINEIKNLFEFKKMNKIPLYFQLLIFDVLDHELLEYYDEKIIDFGSKLIIEIIKLIDLTDNKVLELIAEKLTRKREIIRRFGLSVIEFFDKILSNLKPSSRSARLYKNYLYYLKAMVLSENNDVDKAKMIIEELFKSIGENEFYSTYDDINDLLLKLQEHSE